VPCSPFPTDHFDAAGRTAERPALTTHSIGAGLMVRVSSVTAMPGEQRNSQRDQRRPSTRSAQREIGVSRLSQTQASFEGRYNESATPFDWRFDTADLTAMLERVGTTAGQEPVLAA